MDGLLTLRPAPDPPLSDLPAAKIQPLVQSGMPQPARTLTNTTFFIDSDVDSESETGEFFEEPSSADDVESLHTPDSYARSSSVYDPPVRFSYESTTASTPADVDPPAPARPAEHSPNLMFRLKSVKRSRNNSNAADEHCFRATLASGQLDWESYQPDPVADPLPEIPAQLRPQSPDKTNPQPAQPPPTPAPTEGVDEVRRWSTQQVAAFMLNSGFDNSIVSSFQTHDIDGAVLLDLGFDDLKDLDISSYAKRSQIWNEIKALRVEGTLDDPMYTSNTALVRVPSCIDLPSGVGFEQRNHAPENQRASKQIRSRASSASTSTVVPASKSSSGSVSPQDIPKPHRCSKGTKCPKWQKQQMVLEEVDKEHGPNTPPTDNVAKMSATPPTLAEGGNAPTEPASPRSAAPITTDMSMDTRIQAPRSSLEDKHPVEVQHVVQLSSSPPRRPPPLRPSSNTTLPSNAAPSKPTPLSPTSPATTYPLRQSSRQDLPRLSIPSSPTTSRHTPSNSDSSIINVNRALSPIKAGTRPARSTSVPPSTTVQPMSPNSTLSPVSAIERPSSPQSIIAPLRSPKTSGLRSPSPGSAARSATAPVSSFSRTTSPNSLVSPTGFRVSPTLGQTTSPQMGISESPPLVPAPLFNRSVTASPDPSGRLYARSTTPSPEPSTMRSNPSVTGRRPPMLRAPLSADTLNRRRNVNPLPTLQETSTKKAHRISKPLPATPRKSTSSDETATQAPPIPLVSKPSTSPVVPPTPAKPEHTTKQEPFSKQDPPPTPMRSSPTRPATANPTPTPTSAMTMLGSPPPQTPATPFTPTTPITPGPFSASSTTSVPPLPRLPVKLPRQAYGPSTLRVGWVRRRRARLWRHEWTSAHLRLTNTHLSIHATADASDTVPLESIDVDDYVVACSSIANGSGTGSKLAAAVRGLRLYGGGAGTGANKNGMMGTAVLGSGADSESGTSGGGGGGAFSWQLVPAAAVGEKAGHVRTEKNGDGEDTTIVVKSPNVNVNVAEVGSPREGGASPTKDRDGNAGGGKEGTKEKEKEKIVLKTHHFAVKTRDERIDWMREVMLAKALRQKEINSNARAAAVAAAAAAASAAKVVDGGCGGDGGEGGANGVVGGVGVVGGIGGAEGKRLTRSGSF